MSERTRSKLQKYSRTLFILLAWILVLGIVTEVSFVGLAFTVDGGFWQYHMQLVKVIEFIPVIMFILGCVGGIPKYYRAWSFLLFFFVNFQYFTTFQWLVAIHASFALVIFMIALHVAWGSFRTVVLKKKNNFIDSDDFDTEIDEEDSLQESIHDNAKMNEAG